jgi:hypothetical protein
LLKSAGYLAQDVGNALKLEFGDTDRASGSHHHQASASRPGFSLICQ